jgi:DNA replication protein DnaC
MSVFDFDSMLASIQRANERRARERGFATVDAMLEAEDAVTRATQAEEAARKAAAHRRTVVAAFGGRLRSDVAEALVDDVGLAETPALRAVREWLASSAPVLVLSGGTGTGKTVAAAWALGSRVGAFQVLRATRLGAAFERWQTDREDNVEPLRLSVPTLLVDDLGTEPIEDRRTVSAIDEVFDARQSHVRTVVTTNLTREQIRARYSDRVLSRLAQNARVIDLDQKNDLRRRTR